MLHIGFFCYSSRVVSDNAREMEDMPGVSKNDPAVRDDFAHFLSIPTRWMDNDVYGHVNNVVYYAYFDTVICRYLIDEAKLDIVNGPVLPFTVENGCRYHRSLTFPQVIDAGLRVVHIGNSSVRYEIALFDEREQACVAEGYFVDVFVDRVTRRSVAIPSDIRRVLANLLVK